MSSRFLSRIEMESKYSNCFSINLLVVQSFISILFKHCKTPTRGRNFVNNGTLLRYSLSITEYIVGSVANQSAAFVIER